MSVKKRRNGSLFRFCRSVLQATGTRFRFQPPDGVSGPVVYIVHHRNLKGPLACMTWMNERQRPWVFSVFCSQKTCFRQYRDFTYTVRFGLPKVLAVLCALPVSFFISSLMRSMQSIQVFRGSKRVVETFHRSVEVLMEGGNLLICPDTDNTDEGLVLGEIYDGFLDIERYYFRKTARHLTFVPLYVDDRTHGIYSGHAIRFETAHDPRSEKPKVLERLKAEFARLELGFAV